MNFFDFVMLVVFLGLAQNLLKAVHTKKETWCDRDKHQLGFEETIHG
jgi:hypothetical protein